MEDGTETFNVFDRNLAVRAMAAAPLPNQSLPFDHNEGAGFRWANCLNTFTRNVACDCQRYGFRFEAAPTEGFNLRLPIRQADGATKPVDIRTLPFVRFEDNEAHGVAYGINLGQEGVDRPEPAPERKRRTTWSVFLQAHWEVLAAIDFTTVEIWSTKGLVTIYLLVAKPTMATCGG